MPMPILLGPLTASLPVWFLLAACVFGTDPVSDGLSEPRDSLRRLAELVGYFLGWLVMMIDADRFWQNEPLAIALVPSRRNQVPEALSRFGESYCKLSMSGFSICSNLAAGYADCVRLVEWPDKAGWQKLDGSQRDRVQPGLIRQDPVLVRPFSGERPWPPCFFGCRKEAGPCRSQSRLAGRMAVKRYEMGSKWRLWEEHATLLAMAQLLQCQVDASN